MLCNENRKEKISKTRKEFYESLPDELREKIKACRSEEEMQKLLEEARIELSPDILETVSGGGYKKIGCSSLVCSDDCFCD